MSHWSRQVCPRHSGRQRAAECTTTWSNSGRRAWPAKARAARTELGTTARPEVGSSVVCATVTRQCDSPLFLSFRISRRKLSVRQAGLAGALRPEHQAGCPAVRLPSAPLAPRCSGWGGEGSRSDPPEGPREDQGRALGCPFKFAGSLVATGHSLGSRTLQRCPLVVSPQTAGL